jgi:hypothetical protein
MSPDVVSFASVVHDREVAERYLLPSLSALPESAPTLMLSNAENALGTNLALLYNVLKRLEGPTLRAFVHPDVTFGSDLVERLREAIASIAAQATPWGALGIVGRAWDGEYVFCHEIDAPVPVCALDSCFLLTRLELGLDFDARRFDELHCVVEDYCLQCHEAGYGVWVVPATAAHQDATYHREGSHWGNYDRYRKRLRRKWRRRFPGLTTT